MQSALVADHPNNDSSSTAIQRGPSESPAHSHAGNATSHRHRSAIESRSSNRLSGFFTNFIHRRDSPMNPQSRDPPLGNSSLSEAANQLSESATRTSSPYPTTRPTTPPPPSLPPPTLHELGLTLSALTADLTPSHFSSPPISGAFLAPHYLLLCHAQGLDVLPLVSPPSLQPYPLVRRLPFKSVVVMEQRGVLVAIAGRRDGVRVYALEEVKHAIEWRMDVEIRRERDKQRRENIKRLALKSIDIIDPRTSSDKFRKASLSTPPPGEQDHYRPNLLRKNSENGLPILPVPSPPPIPPPPPVPLIPRSATSSMPRKRPKNQPIIIPPVPPTTPGIPSQPPPYSSPSESSLPLRSRPSFVSSRSRSGSVNTLIVPSAPPVPDVPRNADDSKANWAESSDEEAIDVVAAGTSGEHLDERTSVTRSQRSGSTSTLQPLIAQTLPLISRASTTPLRRSRPSNLDLSLAHSTQVPPPEPSPAPTLLSLRQALSQPLDSSNPGTPFVDPDDDEEVVDGHISLAQALLESRIPELPPAGTRRPQEPILITPPNIFRREATSPQRSEGHVGGSLGRSTNQDRRRRRRWSIMISSPSPENASDMPASPDPTPLTAPASRSSTRFARSQSFRSHNSAQSTPTRSQTDPLQPHTPAVSSSDLNALTPLPSSRSSRFIPRIISNAFNVRRSDERSSDPTHSPLDYDGPKWPSSTPPAPPPKLEFAKLPNTKGALLVKVVETAKKSFLAILCGDNGEKVELFAGTYRTVLGLSRTFILPDSPRSLELQLQGDDLVEVFLVFAQNVFGLEPATVRVREVRIGRAERRAARRRRARENQSGDSATNDVEPADDDTNVNVNIGVSVAPASTRMSSDNSYDRPESPTLIANDHPGSQAERTQSPDPTTSSITQAEELTILATTKLGPYTTFQQLGFAPKFPLASIADEYIIPPTYPSFLEYRAEHEPDNDTNADLARTQFSPPGLPIPTPTAPSMWYYRDPRQVVHGPWKASLMQAWYKDGLLPPDLPVRREEDTDYILLRDLRAQSLDPTQPFKAVAPTANPSTTLQDLIVQPEKPLLSPLSLLEQPRHFGPPALFFSSRGGHSTSVVDVRGRSVLKGKFLWTDDDSDERSRGSKLGDIRRIEAFDIKDRSVLVALRQGGLEAVDLSDALLKPADESRVTLPYYNPSTTSVSRRAPFVWKMGTPIMPNFPYTAYGGALTNGKGTTLSSKKSGSTKPSSNRTDSLSNDSEQDTQGELIFLGRREDDIYFCEKKAVSFRILRLSPTTYDKV